MINSLFKETYGVFEILTVERMFYFFIFNLACAWSDIYADMPLKRKMEQVRGCQINQKTINDLVKDLYKRVSDGENFKRKPFASNSPPMRKITMESLKEMNMEKGALVKGISLKNAKCRNFIWESIKKLLSFGILIILLKNQLYPYLKRNKYL